MFLANLGAVVWAVALGTVSAPQVASDLQRQAVVSVEVSRDGGVSSCALSLESSFTVELCDAEGLCTVPPLDAAGQIDLRAAEADALVVTSTLVGYDAGMLVADTFTDQFNVRFLGAARSVTQTLHLGECSASYVITLQAH